MQARPLQYERTREVLRNAYLRNLNTCGENKFGRAVKFPTGTNLAFLPTTVLTLNW